MPSYVLSSTRTIKSEILFPHCGASDVWPCAILVDLPPVNTSSFNQNKHRMWLGSANTCITCRRPPSSHVGSAARSSPRIFCTHTRAPTSERTILEHIFIASICRFLLLHTVAVFFGRLSCNMNLVKVSVSLNHPGLIDYSGCSVCMCVCVCVRCRFMARRRYEASVERLRFDYRALLARCFNMRPLGGLACLCDAKQYITDVVIIARRALPVEAKGTPRRRAWPACPGLPD